MIDLNDADSLKAILEDVNTLRQAIELLPMEGTPYDAKFMAMRAIARVEKAFTRDDSKATPCTKKDAKPTYTEEQLKDIREALESVAEECGNEAESRGMCEAYRWVENARNRGKEKT